MFEGLMRAPLRPNCAQSLAMLWRSQKSSAGLRKPIYADRCASILPVWPCASCGTPQTAKSPLRDLVNMMVLVLVRVYRSNEPKWQNGFYSHTIDGFDDASTRVAAVPPLLRLSAGPLVGSWSCAAPPAASSREKTSPLRASPGSSSSHGVSIHAWCSPSLHCADEGHGAPLTNLGKDRSCWRLRLHCTVTSGSARSSSTRP